MKNKVGYDGDEIAMKLLSLRLNAGFWAGYAQLPPRTQPTSSSNQQRQLISSIHHLLGI